MWLILLVSVVSLACLYKYLTFNFDYWQKKGIKGPKPLIIYGNFRDAFTFKRSIGRICHDYYKKYSAEKFIGLHLRRDPVLMLRDPEIVKLILMKDFVYFSNRGVLTSNEPLGMNLFASDSETWKVLRKNLTPVFSSGKIKNMFYLIHQCALDFERYVGNIIEEKHEMEIKNLFEKYTLEVICSCAFGIDADTLKNGPNSFEEIGKEIFNPSTRDFVLRILDGFFPGILKYLHLEVGSPKVKDFFNTLVKQILEDREGKEKVRQDFMDLIINLREQGKVSGGRFTKDGEFNLEITDQLIAAQAFVFYAAGFETSAGTVAFTLYELALNENIQNKLRDEINSKVAKHGNITYDAIQEMEYLDMVLSETLRKYPVAEMLQRQCVEKYKIPETNIYLDKGVLIFIPVIALHRDPQYYPDPDKFDPQRFSSENKDHLRPYLPFGDGPRNCIGMRFAKLQTSVVLCTFLRSFGVRPSSRTKSPLQFNPRTAVLESIDGILLDIYKV